MRFLFALIGILFDLLVLAAACFVLYCVVQPHALYDAINLVTAEFETNAGRLRIAGGAVLLLVMSFRGVFLLVFGGRGDTTFVINRSDRGNLSVSRDTLERLVNRIAGEMQPPSEVRGLEITQNDDGLRIKMKISLDMLKCNLKEYTELMDEKVKSYFQQSLGVPVTTIDVEASAAEPGRGGLPAKTGA